MSLSPLALAVFLATMAAVAAAFVASVGWWARPAGESAAASRRWRIAALAVLVLPLVLPALLAQLGLLERLDARPPPAVVLLVCVTLATVALAFSPLGRRLALGIGLAGLVGYQAFRIPVEWFLHRAFVEGVVPVQMTWAGPTFDVLSGASALALGFAASRRPLPLHFPAVWLPSFGVQAALFGHLLVFRKLWMQRHG
jgi:hypothetical protein